MLEQRHVPGAGGTVGFKRDTFGRNAVRSNSTVGRAMILPAWRTMQRKRSGGSLFFFRKVCEATREIQWRNRIIAEFSMWAQQAFDGLYIRNLRACGLGSFCEWP